MVVGICQLKLIMHDNFSLKEKRRVLKKIIERVKNKFPVSIAEVGDYDLWQASLIGFCLISNEKSFVNSSIDKVINFIENLYMAEVVESQIEIINLF
jgi:uncharacterized protein YlxP (DUF503 family)